MNCPQCGYPLRENENLCWNCGAYVQQATPSVQQYQQQQYQAYQQQMPWGMPVQQQYQQPQAYGSWQGQQSPSAAATASADASGWQPNQTPLPPPQPATSIDPALSKASVEIRNVKYPAAFSLQKNKQIIFHADHMQLPSETVKYADILTYGVYDNPLRIEFRLASGRKVKLSLVGFAHRVHFVVAEHGILKYALFNIATNLMRRIHGGETIDFGELQINQSSARIKKLIITKENYAYSLENDAALKKFLLSDGGRTVEIVLLEALFRGVDIAETIAKVILEK